MSAATYTLTGNAHDLIGDGPTAKLRGSVVPVGVDVINDVSANEQRYGGYPLNIDSTGLWTITLIGTGALVPAYVVVIEYVDGTSGSKVQTVRSNAFAITSNTTFAAVLNLPPVNVDLTTLDSYIAQRITNPASATAIALSATFVAQIETADHTITGQYAFTTRPTGIPGGATRSVSASPPSNPRVGDLWAVSDAVPGSATLSVPVSGNSGITGSDPATAVFTVKAAANPTVEALRVADSASTVKFSVSAVGDVAIGKASVTTPSGTTPSPYALDISKTSRATSGTAHYGGFSLMLGNPATTPTSTYYYAHAFTANYNSTAGDNVGGNVGGIRATGFANTKRVETVEGVDAYAEYAGADTSVIESSLYGVRAKAQLSGTGYISHIMGMKVNTPQNNGQVRYAWGHYIADVTPSGTGSVLFGTSAIHIEQAGIGNAISWGTGGDTPAGQLYVESGALKFKGGSGTVTVLGAA